MGDFSLYSNGEIPSLDLVAPWRPGSPESVVSLPLGPDFSVVPSAGRAIENPESPGYENTAPGLDAGAEEETGPAQPTIAAQTATAAQDETSTFDLPPEAGGVETLYQLLLSASQAMKKDFLVTPGDQSALNYYKQVLEIDPENEMAQLGLKQIAARYAELTSLAMERRQYDKAKLYIGRGLRVAPGNARLLELQQEMQAAQLPLVEREGNGLVQEAPVQPVQKSGAGSKGLLDSVKALFAGEPDTQ
jgi:hypothetical protein